MAALLKQTLPSSTQPALLAGVWPTPAHPVPKLPYTSNKGAYPSVQVPCSITQDLGPFSQLHFCMFTNAAYLLV